jgi:dUTP pyrophosphatase
MVILPLDRIAQLIFVPIAHANFIPVEDFSEETERGTGGYGSTGVK